MSNLYAPPQEPAPGTAPAMTGTEPKSMNTVLVLLLVLSALGLLGALLGMLSNLTGLGQSPPPPQPGMPPGFVEAQAKMYEELQAASMKGPATLVSLIAAGVEGYVLAMAWSAKQYKNAAREALVRTALPAIMVFTILKLIWGLIVAMRTYTVFTNFMERLEASLPSSSAGTSAMNIMKAAVLGGTIGGTIFAIVWGIGLTVFYNWSRKVLARPDVEAYYAARAV
ncbi:MAG: hypothetical protein KC492_35950 [Myxococcales bacterium]|nr:hypothetical protein [Myxococcales bacterium]